jgi:urease beta subunit
MIAIIETAFREAWLEIRYNPRESRTVSLGSQPVSIGGDPNICTVYAHNAPPVALRYQLTEGQILCEDIPAGTTRQVQPGDQQMIGAIAGSQHAESVPTGTAPLLGVDG